MKRRTLPFFLLLTGWIFAISASSLHASDDSPKFIIKNEIVTAPSAPGLAQGAPQFSGSPEAGIHLSWLEGTGRVIAPSGEISRFDPQRATWEKVSVPKLNRAYPEVIAIDGTGRIAIAFIMEKNVRLSFSTDRGVNWSPVTGPLLDGKNPKKNLALQFLPDDRLLVAWLETDSAKVTSLHAGFLDVKTTKLTKAQVLDTRVTADAAPAITAFPDGGALIAYRGLDDQGQTDIRTARFRDNKWEEAKTLNVDEWAPKTPPVDAGPAFASRGPHLAAAWFSEGNGARINVSTSSNAGEQWLMPTRIDDITPLGRPSLVLLDDGSQLVTWVERENNEDVILLRRISSRGTLSVPVRLATNITGHPRIVRVKDGDAAPAQILLAYLQLPPAKTSDDEKTNASASSSSSASLLPAPQLVTRLITLPDATQLAEADACDCDPRPEDQRGFGFTGRITAIDAKTGDVTIAHDEIPGLMKASVTTFKAAPDVLAAVKTDTRIFARMERIGADWWLFNPRTLIAQ